MADLWYLCYLLYSVARRRSYDVHQEPDEMDYYMCERAYITNRVIRRITMRSEGERLE